MKRKRVPLNQSALFRIRSFKRLSLILRKSGEELERLAASSDNYMEYDKGGRWIEAPKPHLKKVQERFAGLLAQIETPEYLHSAVRKRSYVSNAAGHTADRSTVKVDIKKFYRSARSAEVYAFARLLKIRDAEERLQAAMNDDERYEALKPLVGRLCEASQIDPITWKRRRDRAIEEIRAIERAKIGQRK